MKSKIAILSFLLALAGVLPAALQTINVADSAQLESAISRAVAGDSIILADGNYSLGFISKQGTPDKPLVIAAANNARAVIDRGAVSLDGCQYVTLQGLKFTTNQTIAVKNSNNCRFTRNTFQLSEKGLPGLHWLKLADTSSYVQIDHNLFEGKYVKGNFITFAAGSNGLAQRCTIDHNYFKDTYYQHVNGTEAIRVGVGLVVQESGYNVLEYNLFENCDADAEVISVKSCDNVIRYNTVRESCGSISLRQGDRNEVYGNYILGNDKTTHDGTVHTGGIKIYGRDHQVHDNFIEKTTGTKGRGALVIDSGDGDISTGKGGGKHYKVYRAHVYNNVLYDNKGTGLVVGGTSYLPYQPEGCIFENNIVQQDVNSCYEIIGESNSTWNGNIAWPMGQAKAGAGKGIVVKDPGIDYASYEKKALTAKDVGVD